MNSRKENPTKIFLGDADFAQLSKDAKAAGLEPSPYMSRLIWSKKLPLPLDPPKRKPENVRTFGVTAGAYGRSGRVKRGAALTHSYDLSTEHVLCPTVKSSSVCADEALGGQDDPPTCIICLARDPRFKKMREPTAKRSRASVAKQVAASSMARDCGGKFEAGDAALCHCGHPLAVHAGSSKGKQKPCYNEDDGIEGATGTECNCEHFKVKRAPAAKVKRASKAPARTRIAHVEKTDLLAEIGDADRVGRHGGMVPIDEVRRRFPLMRRTAFDKALLQAESDHLVDLKVANDPKTLADPKLAIKTPRGLLAWVVVR